VVEIEAGSPFHVDQEGWICKGDERLVKIPAFIGEVPVSVEGISFTEAEGTRSVGEMFSIDPIITPSDAWNKNVIWTSSDTAVASVSGSGRIAALSAGTAVITAVTVDGNKTAEYTLTVVDVAIGGLHLEEASGTLSLGEKLVLIPRIEPVNTTQRAVVWSTGDERVATVTQDGVIVAAGEGTATITVRSVSDPSLYDEFSVTVGPKATGLSVVFGTEKGGITAKLNGADFASGGTVSSTDVLMLRYEEEPDYEFVEWAVSHGGRTDYYSTYTLRLTGIASDTEITASARYYSLSIYPKGIIDTGTPASTDDLQMNWAFGSGIVDPSAMKWEGGASTPLIVGDYVYVRVLDKIHKLDISSGISVASCPSVSLTAFFHFLEYSHGLIFDSATHKIYDTDLNYVRDFDFTTAFPGGEYTYITHTIRDSGVEHKYLAKYTADLSQRLWDTNIDGIYVPFQRSQYVLLDDYLYWISTDISLKGSYLQPGDVRMFSSLDTATGTIRNSVTLTGINGYMMDDGWLTTDGKRLYMTGYTSGLFSDDGVLNSKVAYATVDKGRFTDVGYIDLGVPTPATSQFLVFNGRGYVSGGTNFYVYDVSDSGFELAYMMKTKDRTHGGIVMDTSHVGSDGNVYIYIVPYTGSSGSLIILSDRPGQTEGKERVYKGLIMDTYSSQAVRAGPDGQLIWYNDSGLVYCVGMARDSGRDYGFFVNCGDEGTWVTASGNNPIEALKSVGDLGIVWNGDTPTLGGMDLGLYHWTDLTDRWGPASGENDYRRFSTWIVSEERPSADRIWYRANGEAFSGYTLLDMESAGIPSGTEFTSAAPAGVTGITLSDEAVYLIMNGRMQLTAAAYPSAGTESRIVWSSDDTAVATVDQNGNVRAAGSGWTSIKAASYSDRTVFAVCYVTVAETDAEVPVNGLTIDSGQIYMRVDDTGRISAIITPDDATDKSVTYSSSDPDTVEVDSEGNIIALRVGTATVTVTSVWDPFMKAECIVTVIGFQNSVTGISLDRSGISLDVGGVGRLTATVSPSDASNRDVVWSSSDTSVAVVDAGGNVVAVSPGTAVIFAVTADGGRTATCIVTVAGSGSGETGGMLQMNQTALTMKPGDTTVLIASVGSGGMNGRTVTWASNNTAVASVGSGGNVTATGGGVAVITASLVSADREILSSAVCVVTVEAGSGNGTGNTSAVMTEIVNGIDGHRSETTVQAQIHGANARISSENVEAIVGQILDARGSNGDLPATVIVDIGSARSLSIPSPSEIAASGADLRIVSQTGTVDIPNSVLRSMLSGKTGDLTLKFGSVDRNELMRDHRDLLGRDDTVFEVSAYVGSTKLNLLGGNVKVQLLYSVPGGAGIDDLHLWHLRDDGTVEETVFTYRDGCMVLSTDHFSYFAVGYTESSVGGMDMTVIALIAIASLLAAALAFALWRSHSPRSRD
jgi:uncharacterized protein YjdB